MQSFGIWYKQSDLVKEGPEPVFDLHINFWSLEHMKTRGNITEPFLDVGIGITNFKNVDKMIFHCPFHLEDPSNSCVDLSDKMSVQENASNIFNEECEIRRTGEKYTIITIGKTKNNYLLYPFNQFDQSGGKRVVTTSFFNESQDCASSNTNIEFSFKELVQSIDRSDNNELKAIEKIYLRFRIKADLLNHLYFDSEPLNKSFESAFAASRIINFQVNKKRSISAAIKNKLLEDKMIWPSFQAVHFLLMEPSAHIVEVLTSAQNLTCRILETDIWNDYLENTITYDSDDMLAYHLKVKEIASDYACLIRVNYSKTKIDTIIRYCFFVIALGMIGSVLASMFLEVPVSINHILAGVIIPIGLMIIVAFVGYYKK